VRAPRAICVRSGSPYTAFALSRALCKVARFPPEFPQWLVMSST
jgi:hypothetical protein